jgi:DNA-binding transcriptional MerR regulator
MENDEPFLTIGELARRVGVPVRTIRFWSDSGLVPPASRTDGDRRLYDAACVARLELVTTLRELGVSLASVRRVLDGQVTAAEVAAVHLEALDTEIRVLRLRRAVVAAVVKRSADGTEMGMINKLARLSAAERRQIIDDFTAEVFAGLDPSPARSARWSAAPDLPDDPSAEQVEAWVDLAELVADRAFREQVRQVGGIGIQVQSGRWLADAEGALPRAGFAGRGATGYLTWRSMRRSSQWYRQADGSSGRWPRNGPGSVRAQYTGFDQYPDQLQQPSVFQTVDSGCHLLFKQVGRRRTSFRYNRGRIHQGDGRGPRALGDECEVIVFPTPDGRIRRRPSEA